LHQCSLRLGCHGQFAQFAVFDSVHSPRECPIPDLPFTVQQLSCTKVHLAVHIPTEADVWVIPPSLSPFVAAKGALLVQEIDRVYMGNDTMRWWFLPLDSACDGWHIDIPMPVECVIEQTFFYFFASRLWISYEPVAWTLFVFTTFTGTWFGFWTRHAFAGELLRIIMLYFQVPAFLIMGYSTLTFTTVVGLSASMFVIAICVVYHLWWRGPKQMRFPTRVTLFSVATYVMYVSVFAGVLAWNQLNVRLSVVGG